MNKLKTAPAYSPRWIKLYDLIRRFVQEEPWEVLGNEDVFMVESPADGQLYLCCVMGNGGEEFGLNAFRGATGWRNFYEMISSGIHGRKLMYRMDMLSFSLSPRDFMEKKDLAVTRKLMRSFPGGKWPLIRRYRPHYLPWYLTEQEIEVLCDCLEQALALCEQGDEVREQINGVDPERMLVRRKEEGRWVSRTMAIDFPPVEEPPDIELDDMTIQRLRTLPETGLSGEIDLVHLPAPIQDHEPHYFGQVLVGIDEQHFAIQYGLFAPFRDYLREACESLAAAFIERNEKPRRVVLLDGSPFAKVFGNIARRAAIACEIADRLPFIEHFTETMEEAIQGDSLPPL